MTIGEKLKNAREEKGVDLKEVQEYTKIRKKYLEALENDKFELIPGEAYIRAFIKGYANFLGLEYMELHQQYNELQEENDENENIENHKDKENNLLHNKTLIAAIFVIVILLVLVFFYINVQLLNNSKGEIDAFTTNANSNNISSQDYNNSDSLFTDVEEVSNNINDDTKDDLINDDTEEDLINDDTKDDLINDDTEDDLINDNINDSQNTDNSILETKFLQSNDTEESKRVSNQEQKKNIELIINERSWLQIIIDDEIFFEGTLEEGEKRNLEYKNNIALVIGNAIGVQVNKENEILGPWGKRGAVIRKSFD